MRANAVRSVTLRSSRRRRHLAAETLQKARGSTRSTPKTTTTTTNVVQHRVGGGRYVVVDPNMRIYRRRITAAAAAARSPLLLPLRHHFPLRVPLARSSPSVPMLLSTPYRFTAAGDWKFVGRKEYLTTRENNNDRKTRQYRHRAGMVRAWP